MLDYFKELRQVNQDSYESDLVLWNNQEMTIDRIIIIIIIKTLFYEGNTK